MRVAVPRSSVVRTRVLDRAEVATDVILLGLHAPALVREARPGHFSMALLPGGRAAGVALGIYEAFEERCSLLFFLCGERTKRLAELRVGEELDLVAPLGNGFDCSGTGRDVAIVAGGVGIASVLLAAQELRARGARVRLFYGARSAERLVEAERFAAEGCELELATDDGSRGFHGVVTELLARSDAPDSILACGPTPMLRAVGTYAQERGIPAQLSLEEAFGCGVGGCWGCVVPLARTSTQAPRFPGSECDGSDVVHARVCVEGPVFLAQDLRW
ncbi:MAG TPA: hypothetical protein VMV73_05715 [Candidatus Dormibacteraeota bacterium]|nr:hypothetical protein [Candidatus Dormibacteraeota bacterium]